MAWGIVGTKTVDTQTNEWTVDDITASEFNFCIASTNGTSNQFNSHFRFNTDTNNQTYAVITSRDFAVLAGGASYYYLPFIGWSDGSKRYFSFAYIFNKSNKEKLVTSVDMSQNTAGSGSSANIPHTSHTAGKWVNTTERITKITFNDSSSGEISADTTFNMLGSDVTPASAASVTVSDGAVYYETDTNKSYVLYNNSWTEL
jgi:hypothetical protein|tara:strand:- start:27 stop:632 length:606 start_codon:yes stop_codon:yes gene_type:complete